jgi:acyl-CoA synthetase
MICGVPMVLLDHWDAEVAADLVQRYGVTQTGGTPYFLTTLLDAASRDHRDLTSIRSFGLGATGIKPEHVRAIDDLGWCGGRSYGLTEHPTVSTFHRDMPFAKRAYTDGRLQRGSEVRVVDEFGRAVARGEEGEILTLGPELFIGYTDPKLSAAAMTDDGWFRTGDIGRHDEDGFLTITDRKKDIIIRGGEKISSREVEEMLARHPAVLEATAVSMPDERMGEKVCAYVILRKDHPFDFDLMQRHCRENGLSRFKIPESLQIVSDFPRNPSGKVQKDQLRRRLRGTS